jgi:hypothetical protein
MGKKRKIKSNKKFYKDKHTSRGDVSAREKYRIEHATEFEKYKNYTNSELRSMAMDLLGYKCAHCGITDDRVLQIDHIFGGGSEERRNIGIRGIYIKILESNGYSYQCLCANCNTIKRIVNNEDKRQSKINTTCKENDL